MCKDAPFRVHCNNKRATPGRVPIPGTGFDKCSDPSFDVQLHLIKLPAIDKNADEVEKLIMGAPNAVKEANCKLVQFDGTQEFADYGIGLDGMPAGIACGLTPDSKLPGGQEWTGVSDGNQATNGLNQPVDGPEKAMDFKVLGDKYFCLFKGDGPGDKVCLPPFKSMYPATTVILKR